MWRLLIFVFFIFAKSEAQSIVSRCRTVDTGTSAEAPLVLTQELPSRFRRWMDDLSYPVYSLISKQWFHNLSDFIYREAYGVRYGFAANEQRLEEIDSELRLFWSVAYKWRGPCQSENKLIIPWVSNYHAGIAPEDIRVTYNLCQYYQNKGRQILINPSKGCQPLGDDQGYLLRELQDRYQRLTNTVQALESISDSMIIGTSVGASLLFRRAVKGLPILALGMASLRTIWTVLPTGTGIYFVANGAGESPIRELVDIRNAARLAADGHFVLNDEGMRLIPVAMPIEAFANVMNEFLKTVHK